jgi:dTDP-glucose 4,6-dehydratase
LHGGRKGIGKVKILVTGGAGFIGTSVVRHLLEAGESVVNLDKLTYAGSNPPLGALGEGGRYALEIADVADFASVMRVLTAHRPDAVMHLAAETHVDRSIDDPTAFIHSNLVGTFVLLEAVRAYWRSLDADAQARSHLD